MHSSNSSLKISFIIAAAGSGKRMNLEKPKQFLKFNGEPLIYYSIAEAEKINFVSEIIISTNKEYLNFLKNYCKEKKFKKNIKIVEGSVERQYSIANALKEVSGDIEYVAIHDAARPFLKQKYFEQAIQELKNYDGVVVGVKSRDTVKIINDKNEIIKTLNRDEIILANTPQFFKKNVILKAYEKAKEEKFLGTDDSSLVEKFNGKIKFIEGDKDNIKITFKEDLKFFQEEL